MRPHQVVVWGATGFTGRLVAEHLATNYHERVRWAIAGRSRAKLEQLRADLARMNPACKDVPILVADATDANSIKQVVGATEVVVTTVGPYSLHGSLLVECSVELGTHYCDITGEVPWVKQMYARHNAAAEAAGVRIVHCCGYDSVPSDLGTLLVADYARKQLGRPLASVDAVIHTDESRGGFSGGTVESFFTLSRVFGREEVGRLLADPYYLLPEGAKRGSDTATRLAPGFSAETGRATCVSIMEPCNGRVVHWSNALRKEAYGPDFKFHEYSGMKGAVGGRVGAYIMTTLVGVFGMLMASPLGPWLRRMLPQPGEGPSRQVMLGGRWAQTMVATTQAGPGQQAETVTARVAHQHGDPGYWSTSRMLLECALCLALQKAELEAAVAAGDVKKGGVLSPAAAFGMVLVERLRAVGYTFDIVGRGRPGRLAQPLPAADVAAAAQAAQAAPVNAAAGSGK